MEHCLYRTKAWLKNKNNNVSLSDQSSSSQTIYTNTCNTLIQTFVKYAFLILEPGYLSAVEGVDANFV